MNSAPIKIYLTSRQVAVQSGAHPQQVARMTERGVIKPAAATDSGLKLFDKSAVRIVLRIRGGASTASFKIQSRSDRDAFFKKADEMELTTTK